MKRILAIILFSIVALTAKAQIDSAQDPDGPRFKFATDTNLYDFGNIIMGTAAVHVFEFTNIGKKPLIINDVMASCGCTTPEYEKKPILPGQKSKITVTYNSAGHPGEFSKTVFVHSNATTPVKGLYDLHIIGTVINPDEKKTDTTHTKPN